MISTKTHGSFSLTRPPRDDDELYELTRALWGVTIPRDKHCPHHQSPFSAFATAFFAREPQALVLGSRGLSGKSQMMSTLGITMAVVWGSDANIVGGSEQQSKNVLEHMDRAWLSPGAPRQMLLRQGREEMLLGNGAKIRPLTASQRSVRGPHPARLLLDEIDEMDAEILESAKGQPMPQKNWLGVVIPQGTIMVSTLQYADGTMMKEMQRFRDEDLPIYEWCYKDTLYAKDGWLTEEFVEQKKREVSKERWRVEYELGEPSIGNRAIDSTAVEKMFSLELEEGHTLRQDRDYETVRYEDAKLDRDYVIAADWAQAVDYTVITVWDVTQSPIRAVHYERMNRRPYPVMVGRYNELMKEYAATGIHDATGVGNMVKDYLDGRVRNFIMAGREREHMLSDFISAVERGELVAPRIGSFYRELLFASVEDVYSHGKDYHLPDSFCSAALAWKLVSYKFPVVAPYGSPKVDGNWMARQIEQGTDHLADKSTWLTGEVTSTRDATNLTFT